MHNKINIIPLGGLEEIGKNMTVIGCNNEYIIVDAGIIFPDESMYGVETVLPDFSFIKRNEKKIRAMFVTHAHEDHIGAIPYFVKEFPKIPIYGTEITVGMIFNKIKHHRIKNAKIAVVNPEKDRKKFKNFSVSFFRTVHSIYDSIGIVVETPLGNVVHTGDFKMDYNPIDHKGYDFTRLEEIRRQGVKILLSDSTNANKTGISPSEREIAKCLEKEMRAATGKTIVSTFASSMPRIQTIFNIATKLDKKVFLLGNSMKKNIKLTSKLNRIVFDDDIIIHKDELERIPKEKIIILATGAQGEEMAALNRLAKGEVKEVRLEPNDTVIFSSGVIPGNERQIGKLIDGLLKNNVRVIQNDEIHTSGHGNEEDLKIMLNSLKPEYFMPVHGEYRMLKQHKELAIETGVHPENVLICENGDIVEITKKGASIVEKTENIPTLIDQSGLGVVNETVMRDRRRMAHQGLLVVQVRVSKTKDVKVRFELKGIAAPVDKRELRKSLTEAFLSRYRNKDKKGSLNKLLIEDFSEVIYKKIKCRPLVVPMIEFER